MSALNSQVHVDMTDPFGLTGLDALWRETVGDPGVRVAVIDGPAARVHPVFRGAALDCQESLFGCRPASSTGPATLHGTQVASLIFGRHGGPAPGVAPGCRGLILPVYGEGHDGAILTCSQLDLASALLKAVEWGAHVVNISGGELTPSGAPHVALAAAVTRCVKRGVLVVAAAGNDGCDCLHLPAALPNVLTVGALGRSGRPLPFSNWARAYRSHGLLAPGENLPAAVPSGAVEPCTGTSFATALVSGVAALLVCFQIRLGRKPDPLAIAAALLKTARPCGPDDLPEDCPRLLAGRLDLPRALALVRGERGGGPSSGRPAQPATGSTRTFGVAPAAFAAAQHVEAPVLAAGSPVYAIGRLGLGLLEESRPGSGHVVHKNVPLVEAKKVLAAHPWPTTRLVWSLEVAHTPHYVLRAAGAHAGDTDARLRTLLLEQAAGLFSEVVVAGRLSEGHVAGPWAHLPVVEPEPRGTRGLSVADAVATAQGAAKKPVSQSEASSVASDLVARLAFDPPSSGRSARERARNALAADANALGSLLASVLAENLALDAIEVSPHPFPRLEREIWEVMLVFAHRDQPRTRGRRAYKVTVDLFEAIPVVTADPKSWPVR